MRSLPAALIVVLVMSGTPAQAVVIGNPSGNIGNGEISLGVETEKFNDAFESDEISSRRFLAKLTYGALGHLDVFVKAGTGALDVASSDVDGSQFEGDSQMALGGGVRFETGRLRPILGCRFFSTLQWLQFESEGEFLRVETHKDWRWDERLETSYSWREMGAAVGLSRAFERYGVYGGVVWTRISGQVDREQFVITEDRSVKVGSGGEAFSEGPGSALFVGADFVLGGTLRLSTEYQMNDREHGSFFVGVSETME